MALSAGDRIGRYVIRSLLGAGGMGEVYCARDHELERDVAIKVVRDTSDGSSDRARRFVQEARASSAFQHPNVAHVYEIGSSDEHRFIAMELVEGETLREAVRRGPMPVDAVLEIAAQIAAALGAAHKAGIVHRDIKPENVIVTPDGYAKVLDFGLAKLRELRSESAATIVMTSPGIALGTLAYMAPEQLVGGDVGPPADVFALGVVLYEMVVGERPFHGATSSELASAILTSTPRPLAELRSDVPPKLEAVVAKALSRRPEERFANGSELLEHLRAISREGVAVATTASPRRRRTAIVGGAALALAIVAGGASWSMLQSHRKEEAASNLETAHQLVAEKKLYDAHQLAISAAGLLPNDPRVRQLIAQTSAPLKIESDPPSATVWLQRVHAPSEKVKLGITPLELPEFARDEYLMTVEKSGYATAVRPVSTMPLYIRGNPRPDGPTTVRFKMAEAARVPEGMVFVEGGAYRLGGHYRPSERAVELRDFFIDRYEVSNRDFEQFVRDGGYRKAELWKHPFVDGGQTLGFAEAMERFRDQTGLPGPRSWSGGAPPAGRENHPVTDVTWYEAAAFAEWRGKKLPTIYQWEKAGKHPASSSAAAAFPWGFVGDGVDATQRANFQGKGTMAVDTLPFGVSPYGAHHMAGNVSEWCRNVNGDGFAARGGSWKDAVYAFGQTAALPGFFSSPTLGFRCVSGGGGDEGDFDLEPAGFIPVYEPVDDAAFEAIRKRYDYSPGPLRATILEIVETPEWRREKVGYVMDGKSVPVYLYTPKGFSKPHQVIHYAPAGDVTTGWRTLPQSIETVLAPVIRSGRAIFAVEHEGFLGRAFPPGFVSPDPSQEEAVDLWVDRVTEMRRGLDWLATRADIDATRIGLLGISAGGGPGVLVTALDSRYRSVMFVGTGAPLREAERAYNPAIARVNFYPRIEAPKLMLHGRYDEDTILKSEAEPMFRLLSEPKRLDVYEGGHIPPSELLIPAITNWFDETMGRVGP